MAGKGYVYILTNPSFKENWVKIGMTSKSVEQRVAELDTTGVPLAFEIFAKMRTAQYVRAEKLIHKMIDLLATEKRVRKSREFFNIEPWTALEIFEDVAEVLDDAEIVQLSKAQDKATQKDSADESMSETGSMLEAFWGELKRYVNDKAPHLMKFMTHTNAPRNWYDIGIGEKFCHAVIGVSVMHKWIKIGVWAHDNKEFQDLFVANKKQLEKALGGEMDVGGNKCLSMYTYKDFDLREREKWPEAFDWYIEKFPLLRDEMHRIAKAYVRA